MQAAKAKKVKAAPLGESEKSGSPKIFCGVDNGTSGSIAILSPFDPPFWMPTPIKRCKNYQKKDKFLHRVDVEAMFIIFFSRIYERVKEGASALILLERPYCNPSGFNASIVAARAFEATLVIVDLLELPFEYVDSKQWQSELLPKGVIGRDELKQASYDVGKQLFPTVKFKKDADSLLMAEWARRNNL